MSTGYGHQFHRSGDSGISYTQIAGLKQTEMHSVTRAAFETQAVDLDSGDANYGYKTFEGSVLKDSGEITLTLVTGADASHASLVGDMDAVEPGYYKVLMHQISTEFEFRAVVTEVSAPTVEAENQVMFTVKMKVSGPVTESAIV